MNLTAGKLVGFPNSGFVVMNWILSKNNLFIAVNGRFVSFYPIFQNFETVLLCFYRPPYFFNHSSICLLDSV